jgi:hypothetical protein
MCILLMQNRLCQPSLALQPALCSPLMNEKKQSSAV